MGPAPVPRPYVSGSVLTLVPSVVAAIFMSIASGLYLMRDHICIIRKYVIWSHCNHKRSLQVTMQL